MNETLAERERCAAIICPLCDAKELRVWNRLKGKWVHRERAEAGQVVGAGEPCDATRLFPDPYQTEAEALAAAIQMFLCRRLAAEGPSEWRLTEDERELKNAMTHAERIRMTAIGEDPGAATA